MKNPETFIRTLVRRLRTPLLAALGGAGLVFGQTALVGNSPFSTAGGSGGAGAGTAEAYELAGSSVVGSEVSVCIFERQAKHSEWIPVGGVSNGVHVISFDAEHDRVIVTVGGVRKELGMRKAAIAALNPSAATSFAVAPAPSQAQVGPPEPAPASSVPSTDPAKEQADARMLVSDLLEIGVQQRKAYQEAKQKAAAAPAQPSN
jgi:hypothetical protein